jgi:spermidine/putrescine transport system permease protein
MNSSRNKEQAGSSARRLAEQAAARLGPGEKTALPVLIFLFIGFAAPLLAVIWYSFMPPRTFSFTGVPTVQNYQTIFQSTSYISFLWSLSLAALTTAVLALICYPVAYAMVRVFGPYSMLLTLLFTIPLFVSENIRLYGWVLFFIKNGVLLGTVKHLSGLDLQSLLFTRAAVIFGMVYVYIPFMLFPMTLGVSMVPAETRDAAFDLGATRWQVFREVELPLSMPGVLIGSLLTFVLAVGAIAEAKVLGGQ